jgi:hypothetical protein
LVDVFCICQSNKVYGYILIKSQRGFESRSNARGFGAFVARFVVVLMLMLKSGGGIYEGCGLITKCNAGCENFLPLVSVIAGEQ